MHVLIYQFNGKGQFCTVSFLYLKTYSSAVYLYLSVIDEASFFCHCSSYQFGLHEGETS
jgi:hypothetical protein